MPNREATSAVRVAGSHYANAVETQLATPCLQHDRLSVMSRRPYDITQFVASGAKMQAVASEAVQPIADVP